MFSYSVTKHKNKQNHTSTAIPVMKEEKEMT